MGYTHDHAARNKDTGEFIGDGGSSEQSSVKECQGGREEVPDLGDS